MCRQQKSARRGRCGGGMAMAGDHAPRSRCAPVLSVSEALPPVCQQAPDSSSRVPEPYSCYATERFGLEPAGRSMHVRDRAAPGVALFHQTTLTALPKRLHKTQPPRTGRASSRARESGHRSSHAAQQRMHTRPLRALARRPRRDPVHKCDHGRQKDGIHEGGVASCGVLSGQAGVVRWCLRPGAACRCCQALRRAPRVTSGAWASFGADVRTTACVVHIVYMCPNRCMRAAM